MIRYGRGFLGGTLTLPPSKSAAHRALLCTLLAGEGTVISPGNSEDVAATMEAAAGFGARFVPDGEGRLRLEKTGEPLPALRTVDCGESGSTLRFLLPAAAASGLPGEWRFVGSGRLPQRPLGVYEELFAAHGVRMVREGTDFLPLRLSGQLQPGLYALPGDVSSQFVTGLLLALPGLPGDSEIRLTSPLQSAGYVEMTLSVLAQFGVRVSPTDSGWLVPGGQRFRAPDDGCAVEGDWSQAAFFLSMAALDPAGSTVRLEGLNPRSVQGDRACAQIFSRFGLQIAWDGTALLAQNPRGGEPFAGLIGQGIDLEQIPDLAPALIVTAALSRGESLFTGAARLRLKESDRLSAMAAAVTALGGVANIRGEDSLQVLGVPRLWGGSADGAKDHRVVMALAAAGLRSERPVLVSDEESINKSYPDFFRDFRSLGGSADVVRVG